MGHQNSKRALRRHHHNRKLTKALFVRECIHGFGKAGVNPDPEAAASDNLYWAVRNQNHLAACSCHMCGNPRKHWSEKTMQERRRHDDGDNQLSDMD